MLEKIKAALAKAYLLSPEVKALLLEIGAEFDQLRTDVNQVKSQLPKE